MDWHITKIPERFGSGWTGYSWNRELIPEPEKLLKKLHDKKLKLSLNVHPADGIRAYEDAYPAVAKRLGLDAASEEPAIFDIADPRFRESYFKDVHYPLEEQGVDFWWIDWQQGTQGVQDPLWLLNHYHFVDNCKREDGGLILSRYAGPGSHRNPFNSNLISQRQLLILAIAGGVMILVDICAVIMMKNYKFAGYNMAYLVQLHDFIVREVHLIVRSHGSLRRIQQKL